MALDVASIDFGSGAEWERITIPTPTYQSDFPGNDWKTNTTTPDNNIYSSILTNIEPGVYRVRGWMFASGKQRWDDSMYDVPLWGLRAKQESGYKIYYRYKSHTMESPYSTLVYIEEVFIVPPSASLFNLWLFDYSYFVFNNHSHYTDLILEKMVD